MKLTSEIVLYDPSWPHRYAHEASQLKAIFNSSATAIHHVGSTAVTGLAAKPEIDILIEVDSLSAADVHQAALETIGYRRGSDLSAGHSFFKRDVQLVRTHKLHVCIVGHEEISKMLTFRDALRSKADLRQAYQDLKLHLERTNTQGLGEYLAKKAPFIQAVLVNSI